MLNILSNYLGVAKKEFGYAGFKDKNAITIPTLISLPKKYEERLKEFSHPH